MKSYRVQAQKKSKSYTTENEDPKLFCLFIYFRSAAAPADRAEQQTSRSTTNMELPDIIIICASTV